MRTSEQITEIAKALALAQSEIEVVKKDKSANAVKFSYTYASLAQVMSAITDPLAKHGLAVVQGLVQEGRQVTVVTRILHTSGQWIESDCTMPVGQGGPQEVGKSITYGRRYGVSALLGVVADDDDDCASVEPAFKKQAPKDTRPGTDRLQERLAATRAKDAQRKAAKRPQPEPEPDPWDDPKYQPPAINNDDVPF